MADHCFTIRARSDFEMKHLKKELDYFFRNGVKVIFRKRVVHIHLNDDQKYSVIAIMLHWYISDGRFYATERNKAWLQKWAGYDVH